MLPSLLLNVSATVFTGIEKIMAVGVLIVIGLIIIIVAKALLFFLPAAVIAGVVWFLTGNEFYAGIAFLAIAVLSLTKKK